VNDWYFVNDVDQAPLFAPHSDQNMPNGRYRYGASGFPTQTYHASNYWVDVLFTPQLQ
jgi:hypothetical protein